MRKCCSRLSYIHSIRNCPMKRESKAAGKLAPVLISRGINQKKSRKTTGSNICWPAAWLLDTYNIEKRPVRRTPKCEYLCGGSFMYTSFSFFFKLLQEEMGESTKKSNITHDYIYIYMNFIIISKNYIYVIILSNGRTQWAIIISSSIPTIHAISSLSVGITPICAPAATVQQFVSAYSLSFGQCYAHRFSKLMLEGECYFLTVICLRMIIHSPPQHYSYKLYTNEDPFSWLAGWWRVSFFSFFNSHFTIMLCCTYTSVL